MKFHVITPLARFENIQKLIDMLEPQKIQWHVITDSTSEVKLEFDHDWIHHYICPNEGTQFFERCNYSINWFLETQNIEQDDVYCILNDDDAYEPDFFDKLNRIFEEKNDADITICSMERGHNIPASAIGCRAHPTTKLWAAVENIRVGGVGIEQIALLGRLIQNTKIPLLNDGDGRYIVDMVLKYGARLVPEANVLFNYFELGRWNK